MSSITNISVNLTPNLRLEQALKKAGVKDPATIHQLTINGMMNNDDFNYIAGDMGVNLKELDMGGAWVESEEIPPCTFSMCTEMVSITIPASVKHICNPFHYDELDFFNGCVAFDQCSALTNIAVHPNNRVYSSQDGVLYNKDKLVLLAYPKGRTGDFIVPNSVTVIADRAFCDCRGLSSVTFPKSVVIIGYSSFEGCSGLTSVAIPASIVEIEADSFFDCNALLSISVDVDNSYYSSEDGVLFNKKKTELIFCPEGRRGNYVIPDKVERIQDCAFNNCIGLSSITIPDSVVDIGYLAFADCVHLTSITIPKSVTQMGFFVLSGCEGLRSIVVDVANPEFSSEDGVLFDKDKTELIFCPRRRQGDYVIPNTVVYIDDGAFKGCSGLTSVIIPASVVEISDHAFWKCPALITVHPDNPAFESVEGKIRRNRNLKWH